MVERCAGARRLPHEDGGEAVAAGAGWRAGGPLHVGEARQQEQEPPGAAGVCGLCGAWEDECEQGQGCGGERGGGRRGHGGLVVVVAEQGRRRLAL